MRARVTFALLAVSLAANIALGAALWTAWRADRSAQGPGMSCTAGLCDEERRVREEVASSLCAGKPDRAAITAALTRLDSVRSRLRGSAVDGWLARCAAAPESERAALAQTMTSVLCPWRNAGEKGCCAPSPVDGTHDHTQTQRQP